MSTSYIEARAAFKDRVNKARTRPSTEEELVIMTTVAMFGPLGEAELRLHSCNEILNGNVPMPSVATREMIEELRDRALQDIREAS